MANVPSSDAGARMSPSDANGRLKVLADRVGARLEHLPHTVTLGAALALIFAAMAVLAASPALFVADHWPDVFLALDAALHWHHGHQPHEDFHTPLGAAYVALMGISGTFADFGPKTLLNANLIMAVLAGLALTIVTVRRLNAPLAALTTLYWTLVVLSPRRLAGGPEHLSWAGAYNKWGFALLAALWLAAAVPPLRGGRRTALIEAAILGAILCFLFYLKLTYFVGGLAPFLFRALFLDRGHKRRATLMPVVLGFGMIALAALAGGVSLAGYARDILMAANASADIAVAHVSLDLQVNILLVGLNLGFYLLHYRAFRGTEGRTAAWASGQRSLFLALFILALAVNNQNTSIVIPLLALLPLVLIAGKGRSRDTLLPRAVRLAMMLIPAGYFLWWSTVELRAIGHHHAAAADAEGTSFCTGTDFTICTMRVTDTDPDHPPYRTTYAGTRPLHDELYAALDPLVTPQSRVVHFGFSNIVNARYGLEPARGGLLFWHYRRNFDERARPAAGAVFGDATLVVIPRAPLPNSIDPGMENIYGGHVREHFALAAQTPHWNIYRRR